MNISLNKEIKINIVASEQELKYIYDGLRLLIGTDIKKESRYYIDLIIKQIEAQGVL
jgi:hypothetical protein